MSEDTGRYRFEVVGKIGAGSLFTVYRARDLLLNRTVALKVLRKQYSRQVRLVRGLLERGRRAMKVGHANVCRLLAVGQEGEHVFFATELLEGPTLHDLLVEEAPLPQQHALSLIAQLCAAVGEANRRHCPHGDLRPHNVFLAEDGSAQLTDLGVASALRDAGMSQTEVMLRAIHYQAPERANGAPPSPAADIYSLGVLLYQMLTAAMPFDAASPHSITRKHAQQAPPEMQSLNPRVSRSVEEIVRRCLEKDPRARYPSVDALARHVREALAEAPAERPPRRREGAPPDSPRRRALLSLASILTSLFIVALCLGVPCGAYWFYQHTAPREVEVPDLIGSPRAEARTRLEEIGLVLRVAREEYSSEVAKGRIVRTEPSAGMRVKEGRPVSAVVSRGTELVVVPDVRQTSLQRAKEMLEKTGLKPGEVTKQFDHAVPLDYVRGQSPPASTRVTKGTRVALQVSKGPPKPAGSGDEIDEEPTGPKKEAQITMRVPQGGIRQQVRFVVLDERGGNVVYEKMHAPGDRITETVFGFGDSVRLQIFLGGVMVRETELE